MLSKKYTYKYSRKTAIKTLDDLFGESSSSADVVRTREIINNIFEDYQDTRPFEEVKYAFFIPTRASWREKSYWEEVYEILPALKMLQPEEAFKVLSSLPPFKIEMYGKAGEPSKGVLVFVPVFFDMVKDSRNKILLLRKMRSRVNDAVSFAQRRYGVSYIGLGATLPRITAYGKSIKAPVVTTTGHAGTTVLIERTVSAVINKKFAGISNLNIGFIGGGAIGVASMKLIAKKYPDANFWIHDKRHEVNQDNLNTLKSAGVSAKIAASNRELAESCQVIVSAITATLSVKDWDLKGKVIVDDSQPGSFLREEVEAAGGELVWVVGRDYSDSRFVSRRSGYSYGPHGLFSEADIWGCEAEIACIAESERSDLAISSAVNLEQIEAVSCLFDQLKIDIAPSQSFGQLNHNQKL